ncbi:MAG: putative manganese-dependent inorganic diphosphatase [Chloroflexia bacterium]
MISNPTNPIYVIGHTNPDTDSIAAAVGYADLKRRTGMPTATPARLGELWAETCYLLERFSIEPPILLADVYTRVRDVMNRDVRYLPPEATMRDAGPIMRDKRLVPVVDRDHRLLGAITLDDMAARYLREMDLAGGAKVHISFANMIRTLDGELVAGDASGEWRGRVWVGAMQTDTMSAHIQPGDLVVVGDRTDAQQAVLERGAACVVLVGGASPAPDLLSLAATTGARIIVTPHDSYRVTRLLNLSISVSEVMRRDVPTAEADDLASEANEQLTERAATALPVVDDGRLVGIVSRSDLLRSRGIGVILVDHNHMAQAVEGLEQAHLLEVVDHHNLGDLNTPEPIYMKLEPVGSTCTIVAELYQQFDRQPEPSIAGLLAGGIVSDTLLFRSPTSTERDREAAAWLREIANINLEELAQSMFRANSTMTTPPRRTSSSRTSSCTSGEVSR